MSDPIRPIVRSPLLFFSDFHPLPPRPVPTTTASSAFYLLPFIPNQSNETIVSSSMISEAPQLADIEYIRRLASEDDDGQLDESHPHNNGDDALDITSANSNDDDASIRIDPTLVEIRSPTFVYFGQIIVDASDPARADESQKQQPARRWGTIALSDGTSYEGEWKAGEYDGKGTLFDSTGFTYEGNFRRNKMHGKGITTYSNGNILSGEWTDGRVNGTVELLWSNGDIYQGEMVGNPITVTMHGHGSMYYAKGACVYFSGHWDNGRMKGKAVTVYETGDIYHGIYRADGEIEELFGSYTPADFGLEFAELFDEQTLADIEAAVANNWYYSGLNILDVCLSVLFNVGAAYFVYRSFGKYFGKYFKRVYKSIRGKKKKKVK